MKNILKKSVALATVLVLLIPMVSPVKTFAATIQKCYTILSGNTTVYSDTSLKKKYGTIFDTDEITVNSINKTYCKVTYPISGGRTKTGYISTKAILIGTTGQTNKSKAKIITYKRPGGEKYGSVSKDDVVVVLGIYGKYTQLRYPISGGYKFAFITTSDYKKYIAPGTVSVPEQPKIAGGWQMPMTKAYVCGNGWLTYYRKRPSRPFHLGLDLASRSGDSYVYAVASGVVADTGYNSANGYYVTIKHNCSGKAVYSFYCHLKKKSIKVSSGKSISKGTPIAVYGNTGSVSQGVHLHFAIVNKLWKGGGYYGYGNLKGVNKTKYGGVTYYNPSYVIKNAKLP